MPSFKEALHTLFRVHIDGTRSADLLLIEVVEFDCRSGWEAFSLLFSGPSPPAFWDGTYNVEHPAMGSLPMYLVAIHTSEDGQHYEAVFNRPVP